MRIFETTHAQVLPQEYYKSDFSLPVGNVSLTPLGEEQARLLAKRLKELNFKGIVFCSPYDRTLQTASIIAEELGVKIFPLVCLREVVTRVDEYYHGEKAEELVKNFPLVYFDETFPNVWWSDSKEDLAGVIDRLKTELQCVLSNLSIETDVLLVGHGTTSVALRHLFNVKKNLDFPWNCHLSLLYSSKEEAYANDCSHLPPEKRTENALFYTKQNDKLTACAEAVRLLQKGEEKSLLHIGDTNSADYPYYKILIEIIKPDVIIHTGDLSDELKAGRIDSVRPYWKNAAKDILLTMKKSGARVIVVAGNNDLEDEVKTLAPNVEIVPRNSVLQLYGKRVCVCHEVWKIDPTIEADVYLYGHGLTGETRTKEDNEREGRLYFNAVWGASWHNLESNVHVILEK